MTLDQSIRLIWECEKCNDVVVSYSHLRQEMNSCNCGYSAVDLEEHYTRVKGYVREISKKKNINGEWVKVC